MIVNLIGVPFDGMGRKPGQPGEVALSGGLTWRTLTEVMVAALDTGGCRGWSLVIYNPDLDPDGSQARRIVQFVGEVAPHLP